MLLAIDVGNSHTVLGFFSDSRLMKTWRVSTHPIGTADEFRAKLSALFALDSFSMKDVSAVAVSSVVPSHTAMVRAAFTGTDLYVVDHKWPFSFKIKTEMPEQVGADRLVNAEAALREYGAPVIVVDSGTATTVCAISRDEEYLGGAIMPGIELSIEALAKNTAKLHAVELVPPPSVIGKNTSEALRSGLLFGYASMLDGMIRKFKTELKETEVRVIATGGVSTRLKGIATEFTHLDPDLTLKGIKYLYDALRTR